MSTDDLIRLAAALYIARTALLVGAKAVAAVALMRRTVSAAMAKPGDILIDKDGATYGVDSDGKRLVSLPIVVGGPAWMMFVIARSLRVWRAK